MRNKTANAATFAFAVDKNNAYVEAFAKLLNNRGMSNEAKGLNEVYSYVAAMERDLVKAMKEISTMRQELSVIKEEQKHPVRTMLQKTADGLMSSLKSVYKQILSIKDKIINSCKQAVEDVKDKGVIAANNAIGSLGIKGDLESLRKSVTDTIAVNEKKIAGIEAAATEYHSANRAIKNAFRVIVGKEPIAEIKPNGKLAKMLQAPFSAEVKLLKCSLAGTDKALAQLNKLEKSAEMRAAKSRPSLHDDMNKHNKVVALAKTEKDTPKKLKATEI